MRETTRITTRKGSSRAIVETAAVETAKAVMYTVATEMVETSKQKGSYGPGVATMTAAIAKTGISKVIESSYDNNRRN